jgi:hypothetical protein
MSDRLLIRPDSLSNEEHDGKVIGFTLSVRIANYRGVYLSLHNGYYLSIDGAEYPTSLQSFEINDKPPRSFDEIRTAVWERWDYDDEAVLHVCQAGGLSPGIHTIRFKQSVLNIYDYPPIDEEWFDTSLKPGVKAGSDTIPKLSTYTLALNERPVVSFHDFSRRSRS